MISITLEAETYPDLIAMMRAFLAGGNVPVGEGSIEAPAPTVRKAVKKAKTIRETIDDIAAAAIEIEDIEEEADIVTPEAREAIDLQKLKEQQVSRLHELWRSGKTMVVRDLLKQYGAKSVPEIEASNFPAIKKVIDHELGLS